MKLYLDYMNKKQLCRVLECEGISTQGSKVHLELRIEECLELEGMDIGSFCIEEEQAEETEMADPEAADSGAAERKAADPGRQTAKQQT